ncbi:MAG: metal ABC transporter substrate-binding protein, partial [Caedimonadaceae bacterium]
PHAWHSLENAQIYVDNVVEGLSALLPEDAKYFKARGEAYKEQLKMLQEKTNHELETIPLKNRKVISNHNAFDYLGREFHITFFAPLGISTDAEPSAMVLVNLIKRIKKEKIHVMFAENISNSRLLNQISKETGATIAGVLYSDALSEPGTEADTYLKMMEFNLSALIKAFHEEKSQSASFERSATP